MNRPQAWTDAENFVIADIYISMWAQELRAEPFNKSAKRREGLAAMAATRDDGRARSAGSWEMKCCNISAIFHAAGLPFINGYKPLGHAQSKPLARALASMLSAWGASISDIKAIERLTQ